MKNLLLLLSMVAACTAFIFRIVTLRLFRIFDIRIISARKRYSYGTLCICDNAKHNSRNFLVWKA